ncbi:tRNA pseudouridine synthase B [Chlamydia trachomatis]|nr:tRNA pseudouridine synthase B [Chlamydia trachomatis]
MNCSAGTYIRALARDLGAALGMGAHLTMLRRVQVGALTIDQASSIVNLAGRVRAGQELPILPLVRAAESVLPASMRVSDEQAAALRHGQFIEGAERLKAWPVALIHEDLSSADEAGIVEKMSSVEKVGSAEGLGTAESLNAVEELSGKSLELVAIGKKRGKFIAPVVVFPK